MDIQFLTGYLEVVVMGICLCVGFVLKNAVPTEKINRFIPLIMAVLGIFLEVWLVGWVITPEILLIGLISGLSSTGLYEAFKNLIGGVKHGSDGE